MKFYKKIALFISLAIICFCIPGAADAKTNVKVEDSFKINVLENLNILSVNDMNADFSSDSLVTRGQFAVYIARLINVNPNENVMFYDDLPKTHYAYGMVNTLTELGVINGSGGSFYPDDYITNEQAIKIRVSVLGYTPYAERKGGYPNGFISVAGDIDLLYDIDALKGHELTKIDAVRLLYNSLDIPQLTISGVGENITYKADDEKTFLEMRDIKKYKGQVIANSVTSRSGKTEAAAGFV
ncbi:MAG: S-layer homology domain-containing protein, partial [Clostridia bacterium]|nr:S-layer homology domain-containing protein [Clostridia bacterium]